MVIFFSLIQVSALPALHFSLMLVLVLLVDGYFSPIQVSVLPIDGVVFGFVYLMIVIFCCQLYVACVLDICRI